MTKISKTTILIILFLFVITFSCPDGCYQCDTNNCLACSDGYERTALGNCIKPSIQNCVLFGNPTTCYKCKPTYRLVNNQCIKQYSGCIRYGTSNKCMQCGFGMQLNNNACTGALNCLTTGQKCTQCKQGYKLQGNICKSTQKNCTQIDVLTGACKKCQQNFILSGYDCVANYIDPEFCYVYDSNGKCTYCKEGFNNLEGVCYTSGEMQRIYNGGDVRARRIFRSTNNESNNSINNGSTNDSNQNKGAQTITQQKSQPSQPTTTTPTQKPTNPIDKCSRYDTTLTQCLMCDKGYTLVNQSCYYTIQGCQSYQQVGKSVICKKCSNQYQLQTTTNICLLKQQQDVKDCFITSSNKQSCIVCNQGFALVNGQCVNSLSISNNNSVERKNCITFDQTLKKCKTCISNNFRLQNGICYDKNCIKFNTQNQQCTQCKQYFIFNTTKNICQYKDPNCQLALQQRCSQCAKNYFITNDGYCAQLLYGCQIPNTKTALCSICQSGFVLLANFTCRQQLIIENCQQLQTNPNAINKCAICIDGFYPSFDMCKKVSTRCNGYDKDSGACFGCSGTFLFSKGKCLDPNCIKQSLNQVDKCDICKDGYVFKNGICRFDDVNCQVILNSTCKQCFEGYEFSIAKNKCMLIAEANNFVTITNIQQNTTQKSNISSTSNSNQNSVSQNQSTTTTTKNLTSIPTQQQKTLSTITTNNNKIQNCVFQNPMNPKVCLQCQKSYKLSSDLNKCIRNPTIINNSSSSLTNNSSSTTTTITSQSIQKDPNCQSYSIITPNKCQQCSQRFYLNSITGKCNEVNNLCNTFDQTNGNCLSCFDGFYLQNAKCFVKVQIDPYCMQRGPQGCVQCVGGYFVDYTRNNTCQKMSQFCSTWNYQTGKCTTCKQGYSLVQGQCVNLSNDPYCLQPHPNNNRQCKTCQDRYFLNTMTQKCQGINDNCKTYNKQTGQCYTCKDGYKLSKGLCESSLSMQNFIKDYYCKTIQNSICVECYNGYYLSLENVCKQKNPLCKEISRKNGDCTECYAGYYLTEGACIIPSNIQVNSMTFNKNCKNFTSQKVDSCQQCYPGYRLFKGICIEVNPLCKGFDQKSGLCTQCYDGYYLQGGNCLVNMGNNPNELDPYCTQLSKDFTNCVQCAPGYFVGNDGFCQAFNSSYQCQTYNPQNGKCISCPYSYVLSKQKICIPQIQNCNQYNQQTKCVQCSTGFYLKENLCFPQDIKCQSYDGKSGQCNKCIGGYYLVNNQCIFPTFGYDKFCSKYVNSYCTQCSVGSYLFNYRCREIDSNCSKFDYQLKRCLQCKNGLKVKGISCVAEN